VSESVDCPASGSVSGHLTTVLDPQSQIWESLRRWFHGARRSFPWRSDASPYRVWISEVMLQQTRAAVVVPYFLKWMDRFPNIHTLAAAPWDEVLKFWEGLGYYSRAQRLHQGAKMLVERWGGELPEQARELAMLPGLGPYTVEAIRAFAFKQHAAPVDGNVLRVWSRLLSVSDPIDRPVIQQRAREWLQGALPTEAPYELAEALIELGATVCTPQSPRCGACPLREACGAFQSKNQSCFPRKSPRKATQKITRHTLLWVSASGLLLERGESQKQVLGHLWRLPTFDSDQALLHFHDSHSSLSRQKDRSRELLQTLSVESAFMLVGEAFQQEQSGRNEGFPVCHLARQVRHAYVHTICTLVPWVAASAKIMPPIEEQPAAPEKDKIDGSEEGNRRFQWVPLADLPTISFPSGYRSLVQLLVHHGPLLTDPHPQHCSFPTSATKAVHYG
jgi:A/G-specific adenine glycosylase